MVMHLGIDANMVFMTKYVITWTNIQSQNFVLNNNFVERNCVLDAASFSH